MKTTIKETQELRDQTLSELRESISSNRDVLPGDFVKLWQNFELQNNQLQLKESKDWIKLRDFKDTVSTIKKINIMLLLLIPYLVLSNLQLLNLYYPERTEFLETINNLKKYYEE